MKKSIIATVVGIAALGGATIGGGIYADNKLKQEYYLQNNPDADKRVKITLDKFDMGLTSGKVSWKGDIIPDLCNQSEKFSLRGEDTITRVLSGYTIQTKLYVIGMDNKEIFQLDGNTELSWGGELASKLTVPAGSRTIDSIETKWETATLAVKGHKSDHQYYLDNFNFEWPNITISTPDKPDNPGFKFNLKNVKYQTDMEKGETTAVRNGTSIFSLDSVTFKMDNQAFDFAVDKMKVEGKQTAKDNKYTMLGHSAVENFRINNIKFDRINYNFNLYDINGEGIDRFNNFSNRQSKECVDVNSPETQKELMEIAKAFLKTGIRFDSKGNQIYLNDSAAKADVDAALPPIEYQNDEQLKQDIISKLKYNVSAEIDKTFISEVLKLASQYDATIKESDLESTVKEIATALNAEITQDKLIIKRSQ
ncbi:DUF945 family protein [Neisseria sp.]